MVREKVPVGLSKQSAIASQLSGLVKTGFSLLFVLLLPMLSAWLSLKWSMSMSKTKKDERRGTGIARVYP